MPSRRARPRDESPAEPRPVARKQERSRAGILTAARALVLEKGPDALSLREIAARAGYSPASLYEYFDGRDAILAALAQEIGARLHARLATVPESLPPVRRLVRLGLAYLAFGRESPADYQLLFGVLRSRRRSPSQPVDPRSPFALVRAAAAAGIAAGALRHGADLGADEIAYGLWAIVHGMLALQAGHLAGYEADFDAVDRQILEAFVAGLARGAAQRPEPPD